MALTLTASQQAIYDAYKVDGNSIKDADGKRSTLEKEMQNYWNEVNSNGDRGATHMYMFNSRPRNLRLKTDGGILKESEFKTFPLIKAVETMDAKTKEQISYLHALIKILNYRDPLVGPKLINGIRDNDLRKAMNLNWEDYNKPGLMYAVELNDDKAVKKKVFENVQAEIEARTEALRIATEKRKREFKLRPVPVVAASIHIKTDRRSFDEARYDVSKLITSVASFSVDLKNDFDPGTRLQQYHNGLYSKAQQTLNRLNKQQVTINEYRMRHIKREWDHYALACTWDYFARGGMPPGYNPLPPTNSWITNTNNKFAGMDTDYARQLMNKDWTIDDYLYFDPTLKNDTAGYEAWQIWAAKEKKQYSIWCMEEFEKPFDWEAAGNGVEANTLEPGPIVKFREIRPFKRRKRSSQNPEESESEDEYGDESGNESEMNVNENDMVVEDVNDDDIIGSDDGAVEHEYNDSSSAEEKEEEPPNKYIPEIDDKNYDQLTSEKLEELEKLLRDALETNTEELKQYSTDGGWEQSMKAKINKANTYIMGEITKIDEEQRDRKFTEEREKKIKKKMAAEAKRKQEAEAAEAKRKQEEAEAQTDENETSSDEEVVIEEAVAKTDDESITDIIVKEKGSLFEYEIEGKKYILRFVEKGNEAEDNFLTAVHNQDYTRLIKTVKYGEGGFTITEKDDKNNPTTLQQGQKYRWIFNDIKNSEKYVPDYESFYVQEKKGISLFNWLENTYYDSLSNVEQTGKKRKITILSDDVFKKSNGNNTYEENQAKIFKFAKQARDAIDKFHTIENGRFIHRDIKLENFVVDDDDNIYLIDYDSVIDTTIFNATRNDKDNVASTSEGGRLPMRNNKMLMDRFSDKDKIVNMIQAGWGLYLDYHQLALMSLQLGGVFNWTDEWNTTKVHKDSSGEPRLQNTREIPWKTGLWQTPQEFLRETKVKNFWYTVIGAKTALDENNRYPDIYRGDLFIENIRMLNDKGEIDFEGAVNISKEFGTWIFNNLLKEYKKEMKDTATPAVKQKIKGRGVQSPMQFLSRSRQPVFERVQIESDYGDEEDLQALMEYDPTLDGETLETSSHISDAEFERMLNEATDYDALSQHIARENKVYSDNSTEVEEDAKSIDSKHSNTSELSVASQISNMSANSVASNMSSNSVASNMSAASNLSAASEKSNMSDMSNHSYASHHSMESEEAYPTSEHSNDSYGRYSDQSYNQSSSISNHSSSESSGREMGYSNGLSESSDHGMSESSDHESSNESTGYHSSGGSSSNNQSYNSSSDTDN